MNPAGAAAGRIRYSQSERRTSGRSYAAFSSTSIPVAVLEIAT